MRSLSYNSLLLPFNCIVSLFIPSYFFFPSTAMKQTNLKTQRSRKIQRVMV